jgi:hypothetical protein
METYSSWVLFFHIFHIFSLVNLPFFQFLVFILTMSFSSALIVCFTSISAVQKTVSIFQWCYLLSFSFGHCVACPSVLFLWSLCCLSFCPFLLAIMLLVLLSFSFGHGVACPSVLFFWSLCCLSVCPLSSEGQATQWPKEQGQKDKQQNGQRKGTEGQATQ